MTTPDEDRMQDHAEKVARFYLAVGSAFTEAVDAISKAFLDFGKAVAECPNHSDTP